MKDEKIPRSFGTHDGTFHADEVTACALLAMFNLIDENKIVRTRDPEKLAQCEYVCDVGGIYNPDLKLFDHHQIDYNGEFSSAGMILKYLKDKDFLKPNEYRFLNESFVLGVDAIDNGREPKIPGYCTYSDIIANMTPIPYDPDPRLEEEGFHFAVHFALGNLIRLFDRYQYIQSCKQIVAEEMAKKNDYLLFEKGIPWQELFFELDGIHHPAKFIIMPSGKHWNLRCIPPSAEDRMNVRIPQPKEWAGLSHHDLEKVAGISGAVFCHKGRFISIWESKESALKAMQFILNKSEKGA